MLVTLDASHGLGACNEIQAKRQFQQEKHMKIRLCRLDVPHQTFENIDLTRRLPRKHMEIPSAGECKKPERNWPHQNVKIAWQKNGK